MCCWGTTDRRTLVELKHPALGTVRVRNVVPRFSRNPGRIRWPGKPEIGSDTQSVLAELGYSQNELARLRAEGIIKAESGSTNERRGMARVSSSQDREEGSMNTWMYRTGAVAAVAVAIVWPAAASAAQAQRYPAKPIRLVNPFTPGGSVDIVARALSQKLNETWGQPVIVDNRPGAGTIIGTALVTRAVPDGYTLLTTTGTIAVNVALYQNLPFDVTRDLAPIALVVQTPNVLAVHPSVPATSVQELIKLARSKPGQLVFASSGAGTSTHLTMEMFKSFAKIDMLHVPYKGATPAVGALLGGEVQSIFNPITAILPQARAGKVRALALSSAKRVEIAPDLPTVAESGLPGFEVMIWYAVFAPAATPRAIVTQINGEINRMLQQPDTRQGFLKIGMVPMGGTPEALRDYLKLEISRYAKVIQEAGIKPIE